ncbi:RNA methyltransferase [Clostridium botulinum]|uniref:TlyA family RNA methyltransferase n=1 Tax=Clostridium botulinum TaxID=1491 RepID=UPI0005975C28|nr:TlyA family RNA methyltransferase [Clostridium botulinum]KIL06638.1 RNA methyltransferase [Clostridium botulinum]MBY6934568.1 TlyA family RNA methyltransferase [Clostridium botulinum]NFL82627.1 TlyA family RNA methyltransferase [Clostridium botulinum]NFN11833.1 TlyA family RNA methyltransferase [Clostridium botulinum]NFO36358.1 TlyA family RNA methyltransferase [Clostridium botulinum]
MAEKKERLDILLVEKGIITSRDKAKACIMEGKVFVNGQRVDKAGEKVSVIANIEYKGAKLKYVSRGGLKLEKAMKSYDISLEDKVCMDIGASTGGFTDCMLQNGAKKVYSVDVGYGQFAWKLRTDERVVCMERTNIRYVTLEDIGEPLDFASIDVSFISLKKIMPATLGLLKDTGEVVALIKPQFEAGREKVGKKGVVREISTHKEVVYGIIEFLKNEKLNILGVGYSPIKGPEGNREYLVYFTKDNEKESNFELDDVERVIEESHKEL